MPSTNGYRFVLFDIKCLARKIIPGVCPYAITKNTQFCLLELLPRVKFRQCCSCVHVSVTVCVARAGKVGGA